MLADGSEPIIRSNEQKEMRVGRRLIYGIIDPRSDTLIYVGKTHKRRENRLQEHIERAMEGRKTPVSLRIRGILDAGYLPGIFVLRRLGPEVSWQDVEREQINYWRTVRSDQLPITYQPQTPKGLPTQIRAVDLLNVQSGG